MSELTTYSQRRIDRTAVLTFALAAAWLFGVGSLLALYVGYASLRRTQKDRPLYGRTLAWAGIVVAIFGLAVAGISVGYSVTA